MKIFVELILHAYLEVVRDFPFVTAENLYSIHTSKTRIRLVIPDLAERKSETENLNFLIGFK